MDINEAFGKILAEYRTLEGLSQEDFEGAAHRTYISDLERGIKSPSLETIVKLAERLKVTPTELIAQTVAVAKTGRVGALRPAVRYIENTTPDADFIYAAAGAKPSLRGRKFSPEEIKRAALLTNMTVVTFSLTGVTRQP